MGCNVDVIANDQFFVLADKYKVIDNYVRANNNAVPADDLGEGVDRHILTD